MNLLLRKLKSPHTRTSSHRSLTALHLHFHQCSMQIYEMSLSWKVGGLGGILQKHSEASWTLSGYPQSWTHNHKTLAKEQACGRQQFQGRDTYHCIGRAARENEGNLFAITSAAKNIHQKSFSYITWNSNSSSLYIVLFLHLQDGFHLVIKFLTFYIATMNLFCLQYQPCLVVPRKLKKHLAIRGFVQAREHMPTTQIFEIIQDRQLFHTLWHTHLSTHLITSPYELVPGLWSTFRSRGKLFFSKQMATGRHTLPLCSIKCYSSVAFLLYWTLYQCSNASHGWKGKDGLFWSS